MTASIGGAGRSSIDSIVQNASVTEWVGTDGHWRLVRFNDAAHLHDL